MECYQRSPLHNDPVGCNDIRVITESAHSLRIQSQGHMLSEKLLQTALRLVQKHWEYNLCEAEIELWRCLRAIVWTYSVDRNISKDKLSSALVFVMGLYECQG